MLALKDFIINSPKYLPDKANGQQFGIIQDGPFFMLKTLTTK